MTTAEKVRHIALLSLFAFSPIASGDVITPMTYPFGTDPGRTTYAAAGFTVVGTGSAQGTDLAQGTLLDRSDKAAAGFQNVGLLRAFAGLGGGETNTFTITTRYTLTSFNVANANNERIGGIHLFADSNDAAGLDTGISLQLMGSNGSNNDGFRMRAGVNGGTTYVTSSLGYDFAQGDVFDLTATGTFSETTLAINFSVARNGGTAQTITWNFDTVADAVILDGAFAGLSMRIKLDTASVFDFYSVAGEPSSGPPVLSIMPNTNTAGNYDFTWAGKSGSLYDLVSSTDLSTSIGTWAIWDGKQGLSGTPPNNVLANIPGGGDTRRFFALAERIAPPLLSETFDANALLPAGWTSSGPVNGTEWEIGVPSGVASGPASAFTTPNCVGTNIGGYYTENTNVSLKSPVLSIPAGNGATLRFRQFIDTDGVADFGAVRVLDADDADAPIAGLALSGLQGVGGAWTQNTLEMPALDVGDKNIRIEFNFTSNAGTTQDSDVYSGFYVDEVFVTLD